MQYMSYNEWQLLGRQIKTGETNIGFIGGIAQFNKNQTIEHTSAKQHKPNKPIKGSSYKLSRPYGNTRPTKIYS